ncbi:MAG TPA: sterol desaturase family protein [Steroidobacteraceae bacterium]|nr:sterol desaturase family protein [Steroidobacteraceae bacterium]
MRYDRPFCRRFIARCLYGTGKPGHEWLFRLIHRHRPQGLFYERRTHRLERWRRSHICGCSIHHSAEYLDFIVNTRSHPIDLVFVRLCGLIPLYILGLASSLTASGSLVPLLIVLIATIWGFFIHADLRWRLGPLEWVVSTPAFHHWHHTLAEPRDRNYASMLPWMDRIFGTYCLPRNQWPSSYGIETRMPNSPARQLIHPVRPQLPRVSSPAAGVADP